MKNNNKELLIYLSVFLLTNFMGYLGYLFIGFTGYLLMTSVIVSLTYYTFKNSLSGEYLKTIDSKLITEENSPSLFLLMSGLCARAGIKQIPLHVYSFPAINAFSIMTNEGPVVAISTETIKLMSPRELSGVIAHELSHVVNKDIVWMSFLFSFNKIFVFIADILQLLTLIFLPLVMLGYSPLSLSDVILLFFSPYLPVLAQLKLARSLEFEADKTAVGITKDPLAFISALKKGDNFKKESETVSFFSLGKSPEWLRTHPSTKKRINSILKTCSPDNYDSWKKWKGSFGTNSSEGSHD